jgi:hypothetical protein
MQPNFNTLFPALPDDSRVWLYLADRPFSKEEEMWFNGELSLFLQSWTAHNKKLKCDATILFSQYVVLVVDESSEKASGCSIDSSTHFIKKCGADLSIDFFNRLFVLQAENGKWLRVPYANAKNGCYLSPFLENLGDLKKQWLQSKKKIS